MSAILEPGVFRSVMEELQVGVYFTDRERRIVFWNSGAERITGFLSQDVVGRLCRDEILMHCDHKQVVVCGTACPLAECMQDGKAREASLFLRHKTGHRIPIRIHAIPIRNAAGAIIGAAECFQRQRYLPHPERRESSCESQYSVHGLPEYPFMMAEVRLRLARMLETGLAFGVLCIAVDGFDDLRLKRGQEACVAILHVIAKTLQNTIRPGDCLGSWTDGRLMLVISSPLEEAVSRAGERLRALGGSSSIVWWGDPVRVTISCGGTLARVGDDVDALVRRAERAAEICEAQGGNCVTVYHE
ncbi:MAG TPA: PAS domain-containing protein [Candidatus Koribacter sp.]|jgi:PAS domain S-box-containing protein